jgi:DNA-binding phage protein
MPIRKPQDEKKESSLFESYVLLIGEDTATLAREAGVSRSRIYTALKPRGALGHHNARKIAAYVAHRLELSEREELELRAELIGTPANLVRAYLGTRMQTANLLGIDPDNAGRVLESDGRIYHGAGLRALERLQEMGAPEYVVESVRRRTLPPSGHRMGRGRFPEAEARQSRRGPRKATLEETKPRLAAALEKSGMGLAELRERTGLGRETIRHALYGQGGGRSAQAIALVLRERLSLTEEQMALIAWEVLRPPKERS